MGTLTKELLIGVLLSVFATFGGVFLYMEYFSPYDFKETLLFVIEGKLIGKILSLAAIPNLFVFFICIRKKQDDRAKGVLFTTIIIALTTLVLKFF